MKRMIVRNNKEYLNFVSSHNGKTNVYTTVYNFGAFSETAKVDNSVILDRVFFDFDAHDDDSLEDAWEDVKCTILFIGNVEYKLFFSGRGFHLFVYGKETDTIRNIQHYFRTVKKHLDKVRGKNTLDERVGQTTRLRRIPNTANLSAKDSEGYLLFCIPLSTIDLNRDVEEIKQLARSPRIMKIQTAPEISLEFPTAPALSEVIGEVQVPKTLGSMPILPCLYNAVMTENPSHIARAYLVSWYRDLISGYQNLTTTEDKKQTLDLIVDELERVFAERDDIWLDWDKITTKNHAKFTVFGNYNTPHCDKLITEGFCIGKCWRYSNADN